MSSGSVLIKVNNVTKKYGTKVAVSNVTFELSKASITTMVGPNGAGKTTIAKIMLAIENPSEGFVWKQKNLTFGYIPQNLKINPLLPLNVLSFLSYLTLGKKTLQEQKEILEILELDYLKDMQVGDLSGGQMQRLLIAPILLNKPQLVILDEPTKAMDLNAQVDFYKIIDSLKEQFQVAVFIISHDLYTVMNKSEQVICLNKHICCKGHPEQVSKDAEYIKIFGQSLDYLKPYFHAHNHKH